MNQLAYLASAVQALYQRPVIAVNGKVAVHKWENIGLAPDALLQRRFASEDITGIAIALGGDYIVLDIDDPDVANEFRILNPHLWKTERTETPHGVHLHYRITRNDVTSKKFGSDGREVASLRYAGQYVLVPPSPGYRRIGAERRWLSDTDLTSIIGFFSRYNSSDVVSIHNESLNADQDVTVSAAALRRTFYRNLSEHGRNDSLFRAACFARDAGLDQETVTDELLPIFISTPGPVPIRESDAARRREGLRTVASAYRYEARCVNNLRRKDALPAEARQKLRAAGLTAFLRGYELLLAAGFTGGERLTQGYISTVYTDWGMRRFVEAEWNGAALVTSPPAPPTPDTAVDARPTSSTEDNNVDCRFSKPTKNNRGRGRPVIEYRFMSVEELCKLLEVAVYVWDEINIEAWQGKAAAGAAMLRALIQRNSGIGGRGQRWQASVFGVSVSTIRRWSAIAGVVSLPPGTILSFRNTRIKVPDFRIQDHWLQDVDTGEKFPAVQGLAFKLLGQGRTIKHCKRYQTYLYFDSQYALERYTAALKTEVKERPPKAVKHAAASPGGFTPPDEKSAQNMPDQKPVKKPAQNMADEKPPTPEDELRLYLREMNYVVSQLWNERSGYEPHGKASKRNLKARESQPLPNQDDENTAILVYDKISGYSKKKRLSLKRVRSLVMQYGANAVMEACHASTNRSAIQNPAGYMIAILKNGGNNA